SGPFLFHLAGVLALLILVMAFFGLLRRGELFPRGVRFTVVLIGSVFLLLASLAMLFDRLPPRFALHIETSFGFLSLLIAASVLGTPVLRRVKLGFFLLIVPGLIHVAAIICERTGWLRGTVGATLLLARLSEAALLASAMAAPALFSPRPWRERRWGVPLALALAATAGFALTLATRFDLLQAAVLYGLRMDLPRLGSVLGIAYVLALAGWVYAVTQLVMDKGGMRLGGYGLLLLALAGYQVVSPSEIAIALVGLLSVAVGELRAVSYGDADRPRPGPMEWREYVGRVATAASDAPGPDGSPPEAVVVEEDEVEMSRIRGYRRGRSLGVRFLRRRGQVVEYEVVVGEPGRAPPDATIERHHSWLAKSPEQKLALPRTRTGDPAFDQKFSVHGPAPLGNEALRRQLMRQGDGVVSLWTGTAARYRAITDGLGTAMDAPLRGVLQGSEPVDAVVMDLDTLLDLIEAST
ncbi:MAG TPA: hypothetical protein VFH73_07270, partial [Polyangia bacterium]|nr:hypothetical protein [Polyangia bacterium]